MSKALLTALEEAHMTEYGSVIPAAFVHEVLGLEYPESAPRKVFEELALKELSAVDYVRNVLLGQGKYLEAKGDIYRVCLPSENRVFIERYMKSADKKLKRANRLSRTTPTTATAAPSQTGVRLHMKQTSQRQYAGEVASH